jgi:hypothetical protein
MAKANSCVPQHELEIALGEPGCVVLDCDAIQGLIELHQSNSVDVANTVCCRSLLHEVHVAVPLQEFKIAYPVKIILRAKFHFRVLDDLG